MKQRSNDYYLYFSTLLVFITLSAIFALAMFFTLPTWAMTIVLLGVAIGAGSMARRVSEQGWMQPQPVLVLSNWRLEQLREMHRRGDG